MTMESKVLSKEELQEKYPDRGIITPEVVESSGEVTPAATSEPPDPVEEAAAKFTMLLPYVKKIGSAMPSQKGVVRVLHALAEFPLGKEKPKLLTEGERQLFHVMQELQGLKSTVISDIIEKNAMAEKLKQTTAELPAVEQEVSNGGN